MSYITICHALKRVLEGTVLTGTVTRDGVKMYGSN